MPILLSRQITTAVPHLVGSRRTTGTTVEASIHYQSRMSYAPILMSGSITYVPAEPAGESEGDYLAAVRGSLSRLWATDWDSEEDSVYDEW